jgi:hypothetical protein
MIREFKASERLVKLLLEHRVKDLDTKVLTRLINEMPNPDIAVKLLFGDVEEYHLPRIPIKPIIAVDVLTKTVRCSYVTPEGITQYQTYTFDGWLEQYTQWQELSYKLSDAEWRRLVTKDMK